jgi:hypothetical protein
MSVKAGAKQRHSTLTLLYSIYYRNEAAPSLVSDVDCYVIIRKLVYTNVNILRYSYAGGTFKRTSYTGVLFRSVANTRYNTSWFIE